MPDINIDAIPMLDTAVGLYGSLTQSSGDIGPSLFEVLVTLVLIIYD